MNYEFRNTPCGDKELYYFYDFLIYLNFLIRKTKPNDNLVNMFCKKFLILRLLHIDESLDNENKIAINVISIKHDLIKARIRNKITNIIFVIEINKSDDIKLLSKKKSQI